MDPLTLATLFGGLGAAGKGIMGLFHHPKNPADDAKKYLNQIPGQTKPYYDPYINAGTGALGQLQQQYGQMTNTPWAFMNEMGRGYSESPGYKNRMEQAMSGIGNASAAGGMLGTPMHQQQAGQMAGDIASQDYDNYLNHMLGIFGQGQKGLEGLAHGGQQAGQSYADQIASMLGAKGQYGFAGRDLHNQQNSQNWGNIFGGLGMAGMGLNQGNFLPSSTGSFYGGS